MSAPRRRPQRGPDSGLPIRRRRRQRKRKRPLLILLLIAAVLVVSVAVAAGGGVYAFGSSCDYLMRTRAALAAHGIVDRYLEKIASDVMRRQQTCAIAAPEVEVELKA